MAKEYTSIKELKQASTAVIDVTASNTSREVPAESAEDHAAVTSNNRYVLFVQPFTFGANSPSTGQYANTGGNVAYQIDGSDAHPVVQGSSPKLEAKLTTDQLLSEIAAS